MTRSTGIASHYIAACSAAIGWFSTAVITFSINYIQLIKTNNQMSETCSFRYFGDNEKRFIVIVSPHFKLNNSVFMYCTSHPPHPPPIRALAVDCGDFHLIYASFWFPVRRGIRLKSRFSHPLPGYLLAAQRSICLYHGRQQCFLISVLRLAMIICFTKGVPCVEK